MAFQDFDLITQRRQQEKQKQMKKRIMIGLVSTLVIVLIAAAAVCAVTYQKNQTASTDGKHAAKPSSSPPKTINVSEKAVKTVCATTDYEKTCEDSLKTVKSNTTSEPIDVFKAAFASASKEVDRVIAEASKIKIVGPFKKAAFDDCLVLLKDAKEELNSSISSLKGKHLDSMSALKPELNNWLSAVLSYQQTCVDGFPDGPEKDSLQKLMKKGKELGSNALAMVSQISSIYAAFDGPSNAHRKLNEEDEDVYPEWIEDEHRRMLKADISKFTPNVTVAKDGSGNFTTIAAALKEMPEKYTGRYVIFVKEGVYDESVIITKKMVNVTMYGEGSQKSIITGSKNFVDGVPTYQTATFAALGEGFLAQSLGFRNTAGPEKHQAVALRVQSDKSIFVNCRMEGYQDTLYAQTHRQYYRSCYITGSIDFIFGDAAAVFQNCLIYARKPMENQQTIVTAQGRIDKRETTGIVIHNSKILADEKLEPEKEKFKSYLGRPWKEYSRTVVMESEIGDYIAAEGWKEWSGDFALKTLYYAEYENKGPGSGTGGRVKWAGYKTIKKDEAMAFTVGPFLQGEKWLKGSDVPVRFGMYA